jgi:hypothetical protein
MPRFCWRKRRSRCPCHLRCSGDGERQAWFCLGPHRLDGGRRHRICGFGQLVGVCRISLHGFWWLQQHAVERLCPSRQIAWKRIRQRQQSPPEGNRPASAIVSICCLRLLPSSPNIDCLEDRRSHCAAISTSLAAHREIESAAIAPRPDPFAFRVYPPQGEEKIPARVLLRAGSLSSLR